MVQTKKTKKNKVADFSKPKLKLGKGKQLATNATDTSFKSRSIALPTQSIAIQKDQGLPTIRRNLTIDQLVNQTKHYSVTVRKDGLLGVREFLTSYPRLLEPNLNAIVGATTRNISDEDAAVRNAVYQLYRYIFSALSESALIPHANAVLLHATSAFSHIFADVRVDSLLFLDLIMERTPSVLNGSRNRVLDGYLSLLGLRGKVGDSAIISHGATYARLSISAKARVLNSLSRFVKNTLAFSSLAPSTDAGAEVNAVIPSWIFRPSFVTGDAFNCFIKAISRPKGHDSMAYWQAVTDELAEVDCADENGAGWDFAQLDDLTTSHSCALEDLQVLDGSEGKKSDECIHCLDLSQLIHSVLVSTFLDVAPGVFMPRGPIVSRSTSQCAEIDLLRTIGELAVSIYGPLLRAEGSDKPGTSAEVGGKARLVLEKLAIYFPFSTRSEVPLDVNSEQAFYDLGLSYCELASLLDLLGTHDASGGKVVVPPHSAVGQMEQGAIRWDYGYQPAATTLFFPPSGRY
ncbi:hypothetical protein M407DRAFT_22080 [Tulasnella calospora MUT 4182]|uniref:Pre-rRNA-processing protein n=1 Tax=Tulasnella calospora MUT 4182 TaxID=1051891 RepID=A0A0C3L511_9AGAM|nr:hypothetical protein M407DRAFT_22080 [Tulasnella calospora MUT 4182]